MRLRNLCILAQKRQFQMYSVILMRGSTWGCGYPYHRYKLCELYFVRFQFYSHNRINIMLALYNWSLYTWCTTYYTWISGPCLVYCMYLLQLLLGVQTLSLQSLHTATPIAGPCWLGVESQGHSSHICDCGRQSQLTATYTSRTIMIEFKRHVCVTQHTRTCTCIWWESHHIHVSIYNTFHLKQYDTQLLSTCTYIHNYNAHRCAIMWPTERGNLLHIHV